MTKGNLIDKVADASGQTKGQTKVFIDALMRSVNETLSDVGEFKIPDLVELKVVQRYARKGRNPLTGETIDIPAKVVVKAKVVGTMKRFGQ
jgi:DNA-binding protein HU-beta